MPDSKTDEHNAMFVSADSQDPRFNQPYLDVREWREEPGDAPVFPGGVTTQYGGAAPFEARHLYVHGGFTDTDAKFSFCFPPGASTDCERGPCSPVAETKAATAAAPAKNHAVAENA